MHFSICLSESPRPEQNNGGLQTEGKEPLWISICDIGNSGAYVFDTTEELTTDAITKHNVKVIPADTVLFNFKLTVGRISITSTDMCTNEAMVGAYTKCIPNYPRGQILAQKAKNIVVPTYQI